MLLFFTRKNNLASILHSQKHLQFSMFNQSRPRHCSHLLERCRGSATEWENDVIRFLNLQSLGSFGALRVTESSEASIFHGLERFFVVIQSAEGLNKYNILDLETQNGFVCKTAKSAKRLTERHDSSSKTAHQTKRLSKQNGSASQTAQQAKRLSKQDG